MESQQKPEEGPKGFEVSNTRGSYNYLLRLVAIASTLVAAVVMGLAKETKTVSIVVAPTLPPLPFLATAKSSYSSAFVYFVVVNSIACMYSAFSLAMSIVNKRNLALLISVADVFVLALLFSGNGAATAIGVVGERGISHVHWNKVCNVYARFCAHLMAAVIVSLLGCLAYLILVLLAIVGLHKKTPNV